MPKKNSDTSNASEKIKKALLKKFGESAVKDLDTASSNIKHWFTSGIPALDVILSGQVGKGFPSGRVCELYGEEQVGKTTLGMTVIRHAQQLGYVTCLIDSEGRFTRTRANKLGINHKELILIEEDYLEPVLDSLYETVISAGDTPTVVFWDSVAATSPEREKGCKTGEYMIGSHARPLSQAMRKLSRPLSRSNVLILACNQEKHGAIGNVYATEREREGLVGGKALRFHSDVRLRLCQYKKQKSDRSTSGFEVTARITKNTNTVSDSYSRLSYSFADGGKWDADKSTLRTLQYWKCLDTTAGMINWNGKKMRESSWLKKYSEDEEFRKGVHEHLEKSYLKTFGEEELDD